MLLHLSTKKSEKSIFCHDKTRRVYLIIFNLPGEPQISKLLIYALLVLPISSKFPSGCNIKVADAEKESHRFSF